MIQDDITPYWHNIILDKNMGKQLSEYDNFTKLIFNTYITIYRGGQ